MSKKILINNQIQADKVRVITEEGKNLGVFPLKEALKIAKEKGVDLILISQKAEPPVCKLAEYGKYLYWIQKKKKDKKGKKVSQVKGIRLNFNISLHDLKIKADKVEEFLKEGNKVKIDMILRGRQKALPHFAKEKINQFLEILKEKFPIKIEREIKRENRGFTIIISKKP